MLNNSAAWSEASPSSHDTATSLSCPEMRAVECGRGWRRGGMKENGSKDRNGRADIAPLPKMPFPSPPRTKPRCALPSDPRMTPPAFPVHALRTL
jgi:hypothetical protein